MKNILMTILVAMLLIGCGSGGDGGNATVTIANEAGIYDENTTTTLDFNNSVVIVPTVNIPFEGGDFDITFIPTKDKNLILEENAIMITKSINGYVVSSEWANIYKDVVHNIYRVEGTINYPYNSSEDNITSFIEAVYYTDGLITVFQHIEVVQMGNLVKLPTVTADYEDFTVKTDENGNITITENPPSDFIVNNITADDYINIAESLIDIDVSGVSRANAVLSYVINGNTYSGQADSNGLWNITTLGGDLALIDTFTVTATGLNEYGENYTETAISRHQIKTTVKASVYINNITEDNNVTLAEANTTIDVNGYVTGDLAVGSDVSLSVDGNVYTTTVIDGGSWIIPVAGTVLHNTNTTTVTVTGVDIAENPISETATKTYDTE
jgi:hypothetical protein